MGINHNASITNASEWADAIEKEHGAYSGNYSWDTFSLSYSSGTAAGIAIDVEAHDHNGRKFTSSDGRWEAWYDERTGHWRGVEAW